MATDNPSLEQLLAEIEDLVRSIPVRTTFRLDSGDHFSWLGRFAAAIERWNPGKGMTVHGAIGRLQKPMALDSNAGYREILVLLHQARSDLRMRTTGPTNVAISQGNVFDYFDEIRRTIQFSIEDILFVDPYLDADFVTRYLHHVKQGVSIRLLTSDTKLGTLLPAIDLFAQQTNQAISVRSNNGLHDRYLFVDRSNCYQSGASFKDGAKNAPTTLTQITDAFVPVWQTYEAKWQSAKIARP